MSASGIQIRLFLADGTPGGLTIAEIMNWTGHVIAAPRSRLAELLEREESNRTGFYMLLGEDPAAFGGTRCYIGEAQVLGVRLAQQALEYEFWDRVVIVTSQNGYLTKAHVLYIESRLVRLAADAKRVTVENKQYPKTPPLPEADVADMESFIAQTQLILPVLNINAIRVRPADSSAIASNSASESPVFRLDRPDLNVAARAQQLDGEFTMLRGSRIVAVWQREGTAQSTKDQYAQLQSLHGRLVADGSVDVARGIGVLNRDIIFASPSQAAAIALGYSTGGRKIWISREGTFGQWEDRGLKAAAHAAAESPATPIPASAAFTTDEGMCDEPAHEHDPSEGSTIDESVVVE